MVELLEGGRALQRDAVTHTVPEPERPGLHPSSPTDRLYVQGKMMSLQFLCSEAMTMTPTSHGFYKDSMS